MLSYRILFRAVLISSLCLFMFALGAQTSQQLKQDLAAARKAGEQALQTTLLIKLGDSSLANKDYPGSIAYYLEAFQLSKQRRHSGDIVFTAAQIGNSYDLMGDLAKALHWYLQTLELADESTQALQISYIHNNIGNLYLKIGSFPKSLEHYQKALEIKQKLNDAPGIANALMNLSIFYLKTGNLTHCLELQNQALKLHRQSGDRALIASSLSSISVTYRQLKDYPKAFAYNQQALTIAKELNNPAKIASAYNNLGVLYLSTGDLAKAKENYLKSFQLKKDSKDVQSILSTLSNLADLSLKLNQFSEAKKYLETANALQKQHQFYELSRNLYKINSEYHERTGNFKQALEYHKQFHTINDSLANEQKIRQMGELEVKYEVQEKERNIELLTRNNLLSQQALRNSSKLRNYLLIIIVLVLLVVLSLIWKVRSSLRMNKKIDASRAKLNELNQELEQRVLAEVDIRHQQEQKALRQSRLAVLGELAASIAHELNQPMQTLSLTLENIMLAIQDEQMDAEYMRRKMRYLFQDITRMQSVIEHIRCFSRQSDDPAISHFDLNESVSQALAMVQDRFAQSGIRFKVSLQQGIPPIKGNQYKFEHVILNLLTNGRDAILEKAEAGTNFEGSFDIRSSFADGNACLTVSDNGCGIAPDLQDKVFDIFFTTKSLEKGTGLGLSISAGIIKGMNASMKLDSEPGQGTSISICIPTVETDSALVT